MNVGGKALTNFLKEVVSYRAWNLMDATFTMEHVKESLGLCSGDVLADLEVARWHCLTPPSCCIIHMYSKEPSSSSPVHSSLSSLAGLRGGAQKERERELVPVRIRPP